MKKNIFLIFLFLCIKFIYGSNSNSQNELKDTIRKYNEKITSLSQKISSYNPLEATILTYNISSQITDFTQFEKQKQALISELIKNSKKTRELKSEGNLNIEELNKFINLIDQQDQKFTQLKDTYEKNLNSYKNQEEKIKKSVQNNKKPEKEISITSKAQSANSKKTPVPKKNNVKNKEKENLKSAINQKLLDKNNESTKKSIIKRDLPKSSTKIAQSQSILLKNKQQNSNNIKKIEGPPTINNNKKTLKQNATLSDKNEMKKKSNINSKTLKQNASSSSKIESKKQAEIKKSQKQKILKNKDFKPVIKSQLLNKNNQLKKDSILKKNPTKLAKPQSKLLGNQKQNASKITENITVPQIHNITNNSQLSSNQNYITNDNYYEDNYDLLQDIDNNGFKNSNSAVLPNEEEFNLLEGTKDEEDDIGVNLLEHPNDNQKNDENKPLASFGDFTDELSPEYNERINNNQKIVNDIAQKNKINQTKHTSDYDDDFGFSPQNITNKNKQSELFHKLYQLSDDLNLYDKEIDLKNNTDKSNFKTAVNMLKINLNDIKNQAQKTINENELNTLIKRIDQQNESFINLKKVHENEFKE